MVPVLGLDVVEYLLIIGPVKVLVLLLPLDGDISEVLEAMTSQILVKWHTLG